jgi:hypothetical protein
MPETNNEGLTWVEWARAAGASPVGEGLLRDEWRAGVDPTEYRANPERRDLLQGVVARKSTRTEAEEWLFDHAYPKTGWRIVEINALFCVVKPRPAVST